MGIREVVDDVRDPWQLYATLERLLADGLAAAAEARCWELLPELERTHVDERMLRLTDSLVPYLRRVLGKKVIATFDCDRLPGPDEWVVRYGDYPLGFDNVLCNNPAVRHLKYFWDVEHDAVEFDPVWQPVERIYLLNLDERYDRYIETLRELKRMGAPLQRLRRFSALRDTGTDDPVFNGYVGCSRSHLAIAEEIVERGYEHALVLEDDFGFVEDLRRNRESLQAFYDRRYDYDVCLPAASNVNELAPYDDLLVRCRQRGSTTSGYLLSRAGALRLAEVWRRAVSDLVATRDTRHIADQSWAVLQPEGRFFVFRRKLGFQRASLSSITNRVVCDLD